MEQKENNTSQKPKYISKIIIPTFIKTENDNSAQDNINLNVDTNTETNLTLNITN